MCQNKQANFKAQSQRAKEKFGWQGKRDQEFWQGNRELVRIQPKIKRKALEH